MAKRNMTSTKHKDALRWYKTVLNHPSLLDGLRWSKTVLYHLNPSLCFVGCFYTCLPVKADCSQVESAEGVSENLQETTLQRQ